MSSPDLTEAEVQAVLNVLSTPTLSIGPQLERFERKVAEYIGVAHSAAVSSGTAGLHLCTIAAGVQNGNRVLTTPFSFIASANCILYEQATPIFIDVDPLTGCINPDLVRECARDLAEGSQAARCWLPPSMRVSARLDVRPRMILPVHAFGQPADMDAIMAVARVHDMPVIEDACEAIGSEYKGRKAGSFGDAAVFAFYPNKQITTGEGGMIVTSRAIWNDHFRSLRNQGRDVFDRWLNHTRLGYNYRMDEMSAALGLAQMGRLEELLEKRRRVAALYTERLAESELIRTPFIHPNTTRMSWFVYVVRIIPPAMRDSVIVELSRRGIPSRPYFTPIHLQPFYAEKFGYSKGNFPVTEYLGEVSLALPFSGVMTEAQIDFVCRALMEATEMTAM